MTTRKGKLAHELTAIYEKEVPSSWIFNQIVDYNSPDDKYSSTNKR
jgi:hypothetical protein